ncbi:MAG: metallophosphoesterase [Geminicoccaceae bacterium]
MLAFHSDWEPAPQRTPSATTLLAVGDVHGCDEHLRAMEQVLAALVAEAGRDGRRCEVVMVGDYTDRGPSSLGVLRRLRSIDTRLGAPVHRLLGNHDQLLTECLRAQPDSEILSLWLVNGGATVLAECGIEEVDLGDADPAEIASRLRDGLGPDLVSLLGELEVGWAAGGYLFVHAGVQPAQPLESQEATDLIWIRQPFLSGAGWSHDFAVVHGHTPLGPDVHAHRIGVDSGCFRTGALTAVELADDRLRFHVVSDALDPDELAALLPTDQRRRFVAASAVEPGGSARQARL